MSPALQRTEWTLIAGLFTAGLMAAAQFGKVSLVLPAWEAAYPDRATQLPLLISAVGVVGIALGVIGGAWVARIGPRHCLIAALLLGAGASACQIVPLPFAVLLVTRVAEGLAHLTLVVAAPTLMVAVSAPEDRTVVMGIWGTFFGVSFALGALLFPPLVDAAGLAALSGGMSVIMFVLAVLLAPRLRHGLPTLDTNDAAARPVAESYLSAHKAAYGTPRRIAPAGAFFWHTLIFVALLTYMPSSMPPGAGTILPLASLAGTFSAGLLARRHPPLAIARTAFLTTPLLTLALWAAPESARLLIGLPLFFVIGVVPGASFAAVPWLNTTGEDQARANGAIAQLGNVGTTCGTPLLAIAIALAGPGPAMAGFTVLLSLAGALAVHTIMAQTARHP